MVIISKIIKSVLPLFNHKTSQICILIDISLSFMGSTCSYPHKKQRFLDAVSFLFYSQRYFAIVYSKKTVNIKKKKKGTYLEICART